MRVLQASLAALLLLAVCATSSAQDKKPVHVDKLSRSHLKSRAPIRYVIVAGVSEIEKYVNQVRPSLVVLLDDREFTEANLKTLFELIGRRYPNEPGLTVDVFTSLEAIRTPEENDALPLWGPIEDYRRFKYAFFVRNGYGEWFTYGIPGRVKEKHIWLKKPSPESPTKP